ncbi:hypothetical protein [Mangrovibrevibacter kandeliae]|nr:MULTISPECIES: hypothetical protein [unclassified Aurantimonas]MCQ8782647.1 hypothetical protein [Aurantimonas sp. CSK15Z-1]MCW4114544.1 hypothetical protein [Aurantimonas sp. MSK8Z-1]
MIFALSLTMAAALVTATAISLHNDAEQARAKAVIRKTRIM